ncbi:hypothetical protein DFH11DRAFT_1237363 [Phellopilus nigrolimitatus]|nr:hypothetical protein DFH11DRAFT_1237363 [Phellopilus nigrolimitatus]
MHRRRTGPITPSQASPSRARARRALRGGRATRTTASRCRSPCSRPAGWALARTQRVPTRRGWARAAAMRTAASRSETPPVRVWEEGACKVVCRISVVMIFLYVYMDRALTRFALSVPSRNCDELLLSLIILAVVPNFATAYMHAILPVDSASFVVPLRKGRKERDDTASKTQPCSNRSKKRLEVIGVKRKQRLGNKSR